jgi:tetratricopeptide (TPR) repeat protein
MPKRHHPSPSPAFPFPFVAGEGAATAETIIGEEHSAAAASILQQLLHEVRVWLAAPVLERRIVGALPDVNPLPSQLAERVGRLFELLREEPDAHSADAIALGLTWAGDWLEGEGRAIRSGVVFYQATLLVLSENVPTAYHIGRLLRRIAMYEESEAWLLHVVEKAAANQKWEYHTLALSGLGNLKRERGNRPDAVRLHRLALKAARERGLQRLEGDALYDLAVMHFECDEVVEGMGFARDAMKAYGPGHNQLVRMANDIAWTWMHVHGEAGLALALFQAIEQRVQEPAFRSVLLANVARAAAEVEQEHIYELSWLEAYAYMRRQDTEDGHAAAFGQLALASIAAMQLERARQAASLSLNIARRRREQRLSAMAEKILDAIQGGLPAPERMKELFPAFTLHEVEVTGAEVERNEEFVASLGSALRAREDGAPESPVRTLICGR